jgi:hypothetical protein
LNSICICIIKRIDRQFDPHTQFLNSQYICHLSYVHHTFYFYAFHSHQFYCWLRCKKSILNDEKCLSVKPRKNFIILILFSSIYFDAEKEYIPRGLHHIPIYETPKREISSYSNIFSINFIFCMEQILLT